MSVAAPPALLLRRRSTLEPLALDPSLELGAGGEARVFAVPGDRALVAKIYHQPTVERARKVALMIEEPPELSDPRAALAWPVDLLFGEGGRFAGFLMPRADGPRLFELYNPITRRQSGALCDHAMLHRAGAHLAAAFDAVHGRGYVVGDVNESNVLLGPGGGVTLVDTDSFQVRDPDDGTVHRSKVGKPEFTPPELQGRSFADFDRTPEHDRFGLGVLLFLALMEGTHPFAGRMDTRAETPPVEERIRRGLFPHHGHAEIHPPKLAPPFAILDPEIRTLFVRCFAGGHADPAARPAAAEWREALTAAEARLQACGINRNHRFAAHLDECPWCERTRLLHGRDPFPLEPYRIPRAVAPAPRAALAVRTPPPPPRPAAPQPLAPVARPVVTARPPRGPAARPAPAGNETLLPVAIGLALFGSWIMGLGPVGTVLLLALAVFLWFKIRDDDADPALPAASRPPAPLPPGPPPAPSLRRQPVPHAAVIAPRPRRRMMTFAPDSYVLRIGDPQAVDVDDPPLMANRAELERLLERCVPPTGMHPVDWMLRVAVKVGGDGWVVPGSVQVVGRNPGGLVARSVIDAASRARFHPPTHLGFPVVAWVWFDVTFEQP